MLAAHASDSGRERIKVVGTGRPSLVRRWPRSKGKPSGCWPERSSWRISNGVPGCVTQVNAS